VLLRLIGSLARWLEAGGRPSQIARLRS